MKVNDLVVGSGLFGAVYAREAMDCGRSVAVIDKRDHIGGNVYTKKISDIDVHVYGAHIFHTSDREVWEYVNRFAEFNNYINSPIAIYGDELYNLPFNMNTFSKLWGIKTPAEAKQRIADQIADLGIKDPKNLEEQALSLVGTDVYEKLIKGYTKKQWGRECTELPAFIIKRLPLRFTYDNNYFSDRYQGIPVDGYTSIVEKLLKGAEVFLNEDYKDFKKSNTTANGTEIEYERLIYTGQIDEYFNFAYGPLSWRSVRFETEEIDTDNYQGNAVVNYTAEDVPYTRIIEHKHFAFGQQPTTIISREYSREWAPGEEPYYPVNDGENTALYERYAKLAAKEQKKGVYFGGRLGTYRYYNMDQVIAEALRFSEETL